MMPAAASRNFRPSRRFACDRCRSFKLRCQRDESLGEACERCAKARLACTTTFEHTTTQRHSLPNGLTHTHALSTGIEQEVRPDIVTNAAIEPRPSPPNSEQSRPAENSEAHSRFDRPNLVQSQPQRPSPPSPNRHHEPNGVTGSPHISPHTVPATAGGRPRQPPLSAKPPAVSETNGTGLARHAAEAAGCMLVDQNNMNLDGMDFAMSDIAFDAGDYDLALLMGAQSPPRTDSLRLGTAERDRRGGSDGVSAMFGHHDDGLNGTATDLLSWPPLSHSGTLDTTSSSSVLEVTRSHEPPFLPSKNGETAQQVLQPPGCYIDLIKLSLELVEDQHIIETQAPLDAVNPPPHECPPAEQSRFINRVLNQSSRFWDILKNMSLAAESQRRRAGSPSHSNASSNASSSGFNGNVNGNSLPSNGGSSEGSIDSNVWRAWTRDTSSTRDLDLYLASALSPRVDHMLVVNLVMTYVYLVRSCRAVFVRLLQALEITPTAESRSPLRLPSLQFGDFQLENNLAIQVKVLVEMMTGMLLRIGNTLGISPAGVVVPCDGSASPPAEDRDCRLPFMSDPVAISLREIILSQERLQGGAGHAGEAPPLLEVMTNLRRLLGRRYSVV